VGYSGPTVESIEQPRKVAALAEQLVGRSAGAFLCVPMNRPNDQKPESQKQPPELPRRLRRNDDGQPTAEAVREMKANLTGFFVVLREWSATVKARPPPWRLSRGYYYVYFITLKDIYDDK
jgi:hypothetical protein